MTKPRTCQAAAEPVKFEPGWFKRMFNRERCGKPATHESLFGDRCDECAELARASFRNPRTLGNVSAGRARTEEEIAKLIRRIPDLVPEEQLS